jgi:CelD/BcsL family acetyltransferase involved in cellulose biosynthesis
VTQGHGPTESRRAAQALPRGDHARPRSSARRAFDIEPLGEANQRAWEDAAHAMATTPFGHPGWTLAWWKAFGSGALHIAVLRRRGEVVGVIPLRQRGRRLHAPTNTESPLFEPLAADGDAAAELTRALLLRCPGGLVLAPVDPESDVTVGALTAAAQARARHLRRTVLRSPRLAVTGTWADFEARLPAGRRQNLRRRRRRLEEAMGAVALEVSDGSDRLAADLDDGLRLEASGWKSEAGTAILARATAARFYRLLAREASARGWLRLAFLRAGDRRIAFDYCLEHDGVHYLLKTGFDEGLRPFGPGMLLRAEMVRRAHEQAMCSYELLGNDDPWKQDWCSGVRERISLQVMPRTATGRVIWAAESFGRPLARALLNTTIRRRG